MQEKPGTFDTAVAAWQRWQEAPWGRLRYTQAEANLACHLDSLGSPPLRVLDLGGGDGGDAIRLAMKGCHVTIADYAPAMLAAAEQRAAEAGVADRVTCVEADATKPPSTLADHGGYDVVLSHNLLQYLPDLKQALAAGVGLVRPGGLFSVITINRHSEPLNLAIRQNDPIAARAALDTDQSRTHTFGTTMILRTADEVGYVLDELGCPVTGHYGISSVCHYMTDDERKQDPVFYAELERLELAVADRLPYLHTARFFHLIGRRQFG
ncbi:class I SAM-dependent methyltransferase [Amycolatopsis taiwanensis]|uniref:Methyltransferase n=1 Tax=Amycolatopsis taiwanensis TaxID=342230 RepID=A0A9W6R0W0_9PSEU|nr:methyltransferase domain-containing protein [Amycolatopsis taiwanensis]GLY66586.1 methyltransferase [Amycolatopsis taiwanensis]